MLLCLTSSARAGKDTFATLLSTHLSDRKILAVAFADLLKAELEPFFQAFGSTAYETDTEKKARLRPILVSYGCSKRLVSNGRYWIDAVEPMVREALALDETVIVKDVRFPNEVDWCKSLGGKVVYIERTLPDGTILGPANEEEASHDNYLRAHADVTVKWRTEPEIHCLWPFVERAAKELNLIT